MGLSVPTSRVSREGEVMRIRVSLNELKEILEWCEGVEGSDMPWVPTEIPLYRRLRRVYDYQSSLGKAIKDEKM